MQARYHGTQKSLRLLLPEFIREVRNPPTTPDGPMQDWELIDMLVRDLDLLVDEVVRKHNEETIG